MDRNKLIQRLMATFLDELDEHVRALNRDLLELEKNPAAEQRAERLKTLFRTAHSLKGAARSVNVSLIEGACHRLEEILGAARDGGLSLSPNLFGLLFASVDAMEEAGMRLREQQDLAEAPLAALLPKLEQAACGAPVAFSAPSDLSPSLSLSLSLSPSLSAAPAEKEKGKEKEKEKEKEEKVRATPIVSPAAVATLCPAVAEKPLETSSLRVSADKLDTLVARMGELLVARQRIQSRLNDLPALQEFVETWKTGWQRVEKVVDKFLLSEDSRGTQATENGAARVPKRAALVLRQTGDNLRRLSKELERVTSVLNAESRLLDQVTAPLDDEVRRVRMVPFAEACAGLDRLVRDLCQASGKEAELTLHGGSEELDRSVLEGLKDPLRHLVRNAIDHGIEAPAQRQQTGKSPGGRIKIAAALRGSQVEIVVQDDGRGLNLDALREHVQRRHLPEPTDDRELARVVFQAGFSTASIITDVSGRGVGLDVVKSRVEELHGTVDLSFTPRAGTCFTLTVPLTLTTLRAVLVRTGDQIVAVAGTNVHKLVRIQSSDLRSVAGREMLSLGGAPLPFADLASVLGLHESKAPAAHADGKTPVLIVAAGEKRMAFAVDEFVAEQEILIKNLGSRIRRLPLVAGATLLPSGRIALVLNAANVVRVALRQRTASRSPESSGPALVARKRLLIAEDSVTTRALEKSILEAAGYEVATAVDGRAAWQYLQDHEVDLVVSDVEMPHMDGFELTETIRASNKWRDVPVVLVTALGTEPDKARGIAVGADAYLVKSAFDQRNLLETVARLL